MKFPESLRKICPSLDNPDLRGHTYVGIGGPTPLLLEPRTREELVEVMLALRAAGLAFRILGGGSNLLIDDAGVEEIVVGTRRLNRLFHIVGDETRLGVEAGVSTARFVSTCRNFGLRGAECLIGIPGTVGGAAVMNAGGRHGAIGGLIRKATVLTASGQLEERDLAPGDFHYRCSPLRGETVVDVELVLDRGDQDDIWDRMKSILREKKQNQPLMKKSCGCVFRNPEGDSAGRLLDAVGMKGVSCGDAVVSEVHANFIVNRKRATFEDYHALMEEGRSRVSREHGHDLAPEVEIWSQVN
jgi:UDP-N-acetylmuramate dehydrogenase